MKNFFVSIANTIDETKDSVLQVFLFFLLFVFIGILVYFLTSTIKTMRQEKVENKNIGRFITGVLLTIVLMIPVYFCIR